MLSLHSGVLNSESNTSMYGMSCAWPFTLAYDVYTMYLRKSSSMKQWGAIYMYTEQIKETVKKINMCDYKIEEFTDD